MIDDMTGKGTSIIDLDTVKPGQSTTTSAIVCVPAAIQPARKPGTSPTSSLTLTCAKRFKGYKSHARKFLTDADRYYLYDATRLIAFELGLRFFADYLAGDVYFKTRHEGQNLHRARVQFQLTKSIETREKTIRELFNML